ncbi:uncharacterized protein N7459_006742 [Penicillium hispanicum]|uniref:uncharacterized protein n=1 Tax=Penicillium hispanicum TaxID=1080232 RepID=UPI002540C5DB|nr:uncharacterized protein N7459_006742 [Penicillium hispanicum]KAJ5577778.1 hypothetical protein N7459_006742 [Penicillium hispanicum]
MADDHFVKTDDLSDQVRSNISATGYTSSPRLSLLRDLAREVLSGPEIVHAEPEVVKVVTMLDSVFRHTGEYPLRTENSSASDIKAPAINSENGGYSTPTLPPISDTRLEQAVFTHPAHGKGHDGSYDRLEILGDAYIELIATKLIWERFPRISSGRISQIRELLVKNETLSGFAEIYGFDHRASVPAAYSGQPKRWLKTKGDIFEAYVAAVVLSHPVGGYQLAAHWLTSLWLPTLDSLGQQKTELRSKEELAKKLMGKGIKLEYLEERPSILHRNTGTQTFFIAVYLTGWGWEKRYLGSGQGASKAAAGDEAARDALLKKSVISEIATVKKTMQAQR